MMLADLPTSPASWTEKEVEKLKGYTKDQHQIQAVVCFFFDVHVLFVGIFTHIRYVGKLVDHRPAISRL